MKKTITHPDGSTVVYEGTAEELAQLEEQAKRERGETNESPKKGNRRILTEEDRKDVLELLQAELAKVSQTHWHFCAGCGCQKPAPIWINPTPGLPWITDPPMLPPWGVQPDFPGRTITVTSDKIELPPNGTSPNGNSFGWSGDFQLSCMN